MIILPAVLCGALLGIMVARRRGGQGIDMVHHAAVLGILFGTIGLIVTIVLSRLAQG